VCCSVLQCVAVCCSVLQCVAVCCSVLQCVAVCCSVLQCVAVDDTLMRSHVKLQHTATHCDTLRTATHCTLQHTAHRTLQNTDFAWVRCWVMSNWEVRWRIVSAHSTMKVRGTILTFFWLVKKTDLSNCNTLQHTATHCALQNTAHCNTLHTAKHWLRMSALLSHVKLTSQGTSHSLSPLSLAIVSSHCFDD